MAFFNKKEEEPEKKKEFKFTRRPHLIEYFTSFNVMPIVRGHLVTPEKGPPYFDYDKNFFGLSNLDFFKKQGLYPFAVDHIHSKLVFVVNEDFSPYGGWGEVIATEREEKIILYLQQNFNFMFDNFFAILPQELRKYVQSDVDLEFKVVKKEVFNELYDFISKPYLIAEYFHMEKIADSKDIGTYYHQEDEAGSMAVDFLDAILTYAVVNNASDVHFEHTGEKCVARLRIDGDLREYPEEIPAGIYGALINVVRIRADIDVAENMVPQDGKMTFECSFVDAKKVNSSYDIRVSIIPEVDKHLNAVLRIQNHGSFKKANELGFSDPVYRDIQTLCKEPHGLVLVTGPTGSGKTTTLYSILNELNTPDRKLLTAEDPVEIKMTGLTQVAINEKQGRTFPIMMQHFLRHDPDVILVGEIRNVETAKLAIEAANTGHLVLSTLHTNDAVSAIKRLGNMEGIDVTDFSFCLKGVLAQRLIKIFNKGIRDGVEKEMTEKEYELFRTKYRISKIDLGKELNEIWGEQVLPLCKYYTLETEETQYQGRTAITEFWKLGAGAQDFIFNNKFSTRELEDIAIREDNMLPMCVTGLEKVLGFNTSFSELVKVVGVDTIRKNRNLIVKCFFTD